LIFGGAILAVSTILIPLSTLARAFFSDQGVVAGTVWAGFVTLGWFPSLFVFTPIRDFASLFPGIDIHDRASAFPASSSRRAAGRRRFDPRPLFIREPKTALHDCKRP